MKTLAWRDARSLAHPKVVFQLHRVWHNLGFKNADDFDFFWRKINDSAQGYVPFKGQEDDPRIGLIQRALAGEVLDARQIYRDLGYNV